MLLAASGASFDVGNGAGTAEVGGQGNVGLTAMQSTDSVCAVQFTVVPPSLVNALDNAYTVLL